MEGSDDLRCKGAVSCQCVGQRSQLLGSDLWWTRTRRPTVTREGGNLPISGGGGRSQVEGIDLR